MLSFSQLYLYIQGSINVVNSRAQLAALYSKIATPHVVWELIRDACVCVCVCVPYDHRIACLIGEGKINHLITKDAALRGYVRINDKGKMLRLFSSSSYFMNPKACINPP